MSDEKKINEEFEELDKEFVEMVQKAQNAEKLTKEEIEKLLEEAKNSLEFLKLIDNIKIPEERYVVYTDGELQLIYEDGEFFQVSTTDSNSEKRKLKRKQAIDLYLEYFIKYQINPIIEKRKQAMIKKEKQIVEKSRSRRKTIVSKDKDKNKKEIIDSNNSKDKYNAKTTVARKSVEHDEPSL